MPAARKKPKAKKRPPDSGLTLARLRTRRDFLATAQSKKQFGYSLILQARPDVLMAEKTTKPDRKKNTAPPALRYGLTASRKIGNAVQRNRIRRRLRAVAQEVLPHYGQAGYDYVLVGRMSTAHRPYRALVKDLKSALKRIHKMPDAPSSPSQPGSVLRER